MNKIELQQLKEVSDLLKTLFKYSVYLDDILEKETIKNEKNIANANRYNKEKREENNVLNNINNDDKKFFVKVPKINIPDTSNNIDDLD